MTKYKSIEEQVEDLCKKQLKGVKNILQINSGFMLTKNSKSFAVNLHIKI